MDFWLQLLLVYTYTKHQNLIAGKGNNFVTIFQKDKHIFVNNIHKFLIALRKCVNKLFLYKI